jgi:hypothetical protein
MLYRLTGRYKSRRVLGRQVRVMSGGRDAPKDIEFSYVLDCPCGTTLNGDTEDEIVDVAFAHLRAEHPDMADHYEREHVLFMARRLVKR